MSGIIQSLLASFPSDKGYSWYWLNKDWTTFGDSPNLDSTATSLQTDSTTETGRSCFMFAKNNLIAGPFKGSTDGGSTWVDWGQPWNTFGGGPFVGGLNGAGTYRAANDTVTTGFFSWFGDESGAQGYKYIKADGSYGQVSAAHSGGNKQFAYICYSPALDAYFWSDTSSNLRIYDASSDTLIGTGTVGNVGSRQAAAISDDGYPLFPVLVNVFPFGNVWQLRKVTDTALSYTTLGTLTNTDTGGTVSYSPAVWSPTASLYFRMNTSDSNGSVGFGTSPNGYTWTNYSAPNRNGNSSSRFGYHVYVEGSSVYIFFKNFDNSGKSSVWQGYSQVTTDNGATWSSAGVSNAVAAFKRLT